MKVGIAADHGGYDMKQKIYILLCARGHQVVDFGNLSYDRDDDYPDFAIPLAREVQWSGTAPSSPCQSQCDSHRSDCCLRRSGGSHRK